MPALDPAWRSGDWMSRGACRSEDPELFFPVAETQTAAGRQITAAKAVCGRCLVRVTCLAYAMATGQDGVWGGTTGTERRAWRFAARSRPAPAQAGGRAEADRPRTEQHDGPGRPAAAGPAPDRASPAR